MSYANTSDPIYAMGRNYNEYQRLVDQAQFLAPSTERLLRAAGVEPGMRVLDVGSGAGDVAFLAARLVGHTGSVVGIDLDYSVLEVARQRAKDLGFENTSFVQGDLRNLESMGTFDAAIGRFVLMYTADAKESIRAISHHVSSGGVLAFQEPAWRTVPFPPMPPLRTAIVEHILELFLRIGIKDDLGATLALDMRDVGLHPVSQPIVEQIMDRSKDSLGVHNLVDVIRSIQPLTQKVGLSTDHLGDLMTLEERLQTESGDKLLLVFGSIVGQWARKP